MMKIRIGLPLPFNCGCPGRQSMVELLKGQKTDIEYDVSIRIGADIWQLRNKGANKGQSQKKHQQIDCDYYLSTDWDIQYGIDDINRLLSYKLPIVSGAYQRRDNHKLIHAGYWDPPGKRSKSLAASETGVQRVDWVGGGFLLVSSDALETMEYPWWRSELVEYGDSQEATSADFGFCLNAMRHDIPVHVDCGCKVEHEQI